VWHGGLHGRVVAESLEASGFAIRTQIIWDKTRLVIGRGDYHWQHEPLIHAVRRGKSGHWSGGRNQTTVWQIPHRKSETGHGTQKPVECMKRPIENNSSPGQAVYEPFCGSGTTIIAAEITGRACHAIELNPAYVDVAVDRWQKFTGEDAVLEEDGRTFNQVAAGAANRRGPRTAPLRQSAEPLGDHQERRPPGDPPQVPGLLLRPAGRGQQVPPHHVRSLAVPLRQGPRPQPQPRLREILRLHGWFWAARRRG
jgi:hypothetical protein